MSSINNINNKTNVPLSNTTPQTRTPKDVSPPPENKTPGLQDKYEPSAPKTQTKSPGNPDIYEPSAPEKPKKPTYNALSCALSPINCFWDNQIYDLKPKDTLSISLGGDVGFKGAKLAGEGNIEVKCNEDGTYSLRTGGKLGAGVEASLAKIKIPGVKAGAEVSAGALLSAGSQVEFTFNSPQDAVRAAGYFSIQAAGITPVGMALTAPSQIKSAFDGDIVFLAKHLSAIELSGEVSGQLQAKLGLKSIFEVGAGAETKASLSARLELEQGKPSALVFSEEMSAGLEGALGLNLEGNLRSKAAEGALSINGGSASGSIKLTAERRFSIDSSQYKSLADLNKLNTSETERTLTTTVEGTFNGIASSSGKTSRLELSLHGTPSELSGKELINSLFQGNFAEAAKRVGDNIQCTMTRSEVSSSGGSFNPSAKVLGTGMSAELNYEKTSPREISREKASLTQLAQSFAEWAKSALNPPVRMGGGASGQW